jgi:hypothetical protein
MTSRADAYPLKAPTHHRLLGTTLASAAQTPRGAEPDAPPSRRQSTSIRRAGFPKTVVLLATLRMTTLPMPIVAQSPTFLPG